MTTNEMMRALVQRSHRGPDDLVLTDVRRPSPGPGEYLVRVGAAGINFADVMQTRGTYGGGPPPPYVAGFEAAGEIIATGRNHPAAPSSPVRGRPVPSVRGRSVSGVASSAPARVRLRSTS